MSDTIRLNLTNDEFFNVINNASRLDPEMIVIEVPSCAVMRQGHPIDLDAVKLTASCNGHEVALSPVQCGILEVMQDEKAIGAGRLKKTVVGDEMGKKSFVEKIRNLSLALCNAEIPYSLHVNEEDRVFLLAS